MPKLSQASKKKMQKRILDAARFCIGRDGIAGASIQDIVANARCSLGTIYNYYDGKDGLIAGILEGMSADLLQDIWKIPRGTSVPEYVRAAYEAWRKYFPGSVDRDGQGSDTTRRAHLFIIMESALNARLRMIWRATQSSIIASMTACFEAHFGSDKLRSRGFDAQAVAKMLFAVFMGSAIDGDDSDVEVTVASQLLPFLSALEDSTEASVWIGAGI
jgi:AcrR family transcriptional regulator